MNLLNCFVDFISYSIYFQIRNDKLFMENGETVELLWIIVLIMIEYSKLYTLPSLDRMFYYGIVLSFCLCKYVGTIAVQIMGLYSMKNTTLLCYYLFTRYIQYMCTVEAYR